MSAPERREQLLDVTTALALARGFHDVSIEAVARDAGITRALVYQHFGDLPALLEAVVAREMARALSQVSETTLTDLREGDPRELMLDSLRAFLTAVRDHPRTWRLVLLPPEGAPPSLRTSIARGRARVLGQLATAVRPVLAPGRESRHAELTASILSAISDEYARLVLTDPVRYTPDRLLRHARWLLQHPALESPPPRP
ncbi:MAG TPA: TetR/AcrR family transcriptional regulator [Solirubrobacteraceae bacterium]